MPLGHAVDPTALVSGQKAVPVERAALLAAGSVSVLAAVLLEHAVHLKAAMVPCQLAALLEGAVHPDRQTRADHCPLPFYLS